MRKNNWILLLPVIVVGLSSCSDSCDVSSAEGAAKCSCKLLKEFDEAKGDEEKARAVSAKYDRFLNDLEKNINEGVYTEEEVNEQIAKMDNCK